VAGLGDLRPLAGAASDKAGDGGEAGKSVSWRGTTQAGRQTYPIQDAGVRLRSISGVEPPLNQPWYGIGFGAAFRRALRKGGAFAGRASPGEFWWFFLTNLLAHAATVLASVGQLSVPTWIDLLGGGGLLWAYLQIVPPFVYMGFESLPFWANLAWWLVMLVPNLALTCRRLHDAGHSSAWFLIFFAPVIGPVWLLTSLAQPAAIKGDRYDQPASGARPY
jgi:uncharacterized membrane protein YhaH (DUF805 family)